MRQLFLPACVCLVTWSGSTNPDARFTLDEFSGKGFTQSGVAHASVAPTAAIETSGVSTRNDWREESAFAEIKIPVDAIAAEPVANIAALTPAPAPEVTAVESRSVDDILANLAIEFPVPSGVVVNNGINAGIPLPPIAKPVIVRSEEEICDTLTKSAQINNLPAPFFIRLLFQESGFKPGVISNAGAQGIAQFMPATAEGMGVSNPFDPREAIPASARLLNELLQQFGNLGLAAAAYNAGPKRIVDWLNSKGKGKLPDETQGYVKTITGKPVENWTHAEAKHPGAKLPKRAPCQDAAGLLAYNGPDSVPMPQSAPSRNAPEKIDDKPVVVASLVRSDMMHADRAERIADAAKSIEKSIARTVMPKLAVVAKSNVKPAAMKLASVQPAPIMKPEKTAGRVEMTINVKPAAKTVAGVKPEAAKVAAKPETKAVVASAAKADVKVDAKASIKPALGRRKIKTAEDVSTKPLKIAQQ